LANASNDQFKSHPEDLPARVPEGMVGVLISLTLASLLNFLCIHS